MGKLWKYIKYHWGRLFAITDEERFPAKDDKQRAYRKEFDGIVDQCLIDYSSETDDKTGKIIYHRIVYIDANNDIKWRLSTAARLSGEDEIKHNRAMSKLRIAQSLPVNNLSQEEILNYKKMLGWGYSAAIVQDWQEVDTAISEATRYREARNKERSRFMLLGAATVYMVLLTIAYFLYICIEQSIHGIAEVPHFNMVTAMSMGALGAYVSIWTRYGKMDMTGLGTRGLHYLEAASRMLIGSIFAMIIIFALKTEILSFSLPAAPADKYWCALLGFCAGFSEKWIPSVLENFMGKVDVQQVSEQQTISKTEQPKNEKDEPSQARKQKDERQKETAVKREDGVTEQKDLNKRDSSINNGILLQKMGVNVKQKSAGTSSLLSGKTVKIGKPM